MSTGVDNSVVPRANVAIVGGGFSGTTLAAQLLRRTGPSFSVLVVEKTSSVGRGLAYGKQSRSLLLNVRARNMSALPTILTIFCAGLNRTLIPPPARAVSCRAKSTGAMSRRFCAKRLRRLADNDWNGSKTKRLPWLQPAVERWKSV
jgi:hypothetical protein